MSEQFARVDAAVSTNARLVRFGTFELDSCSGELKRNGRRVPLQDQPARALCLLASRPGQLVTRDELRQALWSADTFLEFDTALNIVVTKVRHALGDVAASPRFIETVPKRGYRFIADVREGETAPATNSADETESVPRRRFTDGIDRSVDAGARRVSRARLARWLAGTLILAGVSVAASHFWRPDRMTKPAEPPVMQLEVNLGPGVSLRTGPGPSIAISPNGKRLAFVSDGRLMTRRLDQRDSMPLRGTDGLTSFFFSPDGESVAFVAHGKLRRLALDGTSVVTITDAPEGRGGSWAEDGAIVFAGIFGGLMRVTSRGGPAEPLTRLEPNEFTHRWPQFLPGGHAVLFTSNTTPTWWSRGRVEALSLAYGRRSCFRTSPLRRFGADANGNGYLTFVRNGVLLAAAFDPIRLELTGQPFPVLDDVAYDNTGAAHVDLSRTGTIVARTQTQFRLAWLESSSSIRVFGKPGNYEAPALSRDGTLVAYSSTGDLWVYDVLRDVRTQVTKGLAVTRPKHWTPDDRFIVFSTPEGIWRARPDGANPQLVVPAAPPRVRVASSSASDRHGQSPCFSRGDDGHRLAVGPLDHSRRPRRHPRGGARGVPPNRRGRKGVRPLTGRPMGSLCRERERWTIRRFRARVSRRRTPVEGLRWRRRISTVVCVAVHTLLRGRRPTDGGPLLRQRYGVHSRQAARVVAATARGRTRTESLSLFGVCGRQPRRRSGSRGRVGTGTRDVISRSGSTPSPTSGTACRPAADLKKSIAEQSAHEHRVTAASHPSARRVPQL